MRYVFGRRYAYATLCNHMENRSYTTLVRWNITRVFDRYSDDINDGDYLPACKEGEFLFDITDAMPIRPAADCVLGTMELVASGYCNPDVPEDEDYMEEHMTRYAKKHGFTCLVEYTAGYEMTKQVFHYEKNPAARGYEGLYTFKPGV